MKRFFVPIAVLLGLAACQKHTISSADQLTITIDTSKGSIITRNDTFLVRLYVADSMDAVPLVYSLPAGARASSGSPANGAIFGAAKAGPNYWKDTVDISGNKVQLVTVTAEGGETHSYAIAYEYIVESLQLPFGANYVYSFCFDGKTIYAGTDKGLLQSTSGGAGYNLMPGVGVDPLVGYSNVYSVYGKGNMIYAATDSGVAVSSNGGSSWVVKVLKPRLPNGVGFPVRQLFVQGDTVYAACDAGVYISRDRGTSFDSSANNFQPELPGVSYPGVMSIYANGSTVYAGTRSGFYSSTDGGRHFTGYNSLQEKEEYPQTVNGIAVNGGMIYVGIGDGLYVSADGGQTFNPDVYGGLWSTSNTGMVAVSGSTVVAGGSGLFVSADGGKRFSRLTASSGLGGRVGDFWAWSVGIEGNTIYCGYQNYIARLTPR